MAATYKLQIHSRDVLNIGNHTGYDLIKYVNGKPTEIRSLDLTWSGLLDIEIHDSEWQDAVQTEDGQIWGKKVFLGNKEVDYTPEMVKDEDFHTVTLINDSEKAQEVFSWMLLDAQFRNKLKNVDGGLLTYDALELNCNVWTNTMAQNYLPGLDVFSGFKAFDDLEFKGSDKTMTTGAEGKDLANCQQIASFLSKFKNEISSKNYDISKAKVKLENSSEGWHCIISDCEINGIKKTYIYDTAGDCFIRLTEDQDTVARLDDGNNAIYLGNGNNEIYGGSARDHIDCGAGNDKVYAGDGENIVNLEDGEDYYEGGKDVDTVTTRSGKSTIYTYAGNDRVETLVGARTTDTNHIYLGEGGDTFIGGVGKDIVDGGVSEDIESNENTIHLGGGNDQYYGGIGKDIVNSGSGWNTIHTGAGRDKVDTTEANTEDRNKVYLGAGSDTFEGGKGRDIVNGGVYDSYNNSVDGESDTNEVRLGGGNDEYYGDAGIDKVRGGSGDDVIYGGANTDILYGDGGNDIIDGGEGDNELYGGTGNDKIYAGSGNDTIKAGTGADYISAGGGTNYIYLGKDEAGDTVYLHNTTGGVDHIYQSTQGDLISSYYSYTVQEKGKDLIYKFDNGSSAILHDVLDKEDPDDPESPTIPGENGIPYFADPDGNVLEYDPITKQMKDTGYDLPKNQCPIPGKKPIPGEETPADLLPPDPYDKQPEDGEGQYQDPDNEPGGLGKPEDTTPLGEKGDDLTRPIFPGSGLWTPIDNNFGKGETTKSPLIIDLNGDGVKTVSAENGVYFDHAGDGFAERTGWVSREDGLLVYDRNNNGKIENGTELFGDNTLLANGNKAENGFEALKEFDSNNDGILDQNDAEWHKLQIWQDTNQNGRTEAGELKSLDETGIKSIDLNYIEKQITDSNHNEQKQTSTVTMADGSTANIIDIWFDTHTEDSQQTSYIEVSDDAKTLPEVYGFGKVYSLRQAMSLDETGELKSLVEQYINFSYYMTIEREKASDENSGNSNNPEISLGVVVPPIIMMKPNAEEERQALLYDIIYHWAGVQDMPINGRDPTQVYGKVIDDTRKLEALEEFLGKDFLGTWCWGERDPNPHGKAAPYILRAFDMLATYVENQLLKQSDYKELLQNISVTHDATNETSVDISQMLPLLAEKYNNNCFREEQLMAKFAQIIQDIENSADIIAAIRGQGNATGTAFEQALASFGDIRGTDRADKITGTLGIDYINGYAGNDTIYASAGNDEINGDSGNDRIFAEDGDDILIGGVGNDYLNGGNGADIYIFEKGFGKDELDNSSENDEGGANNQDVIKFGEGILPEKTTLQRQNFDLIINVTYDDTTLGTDTLRILGYFDEEGKTNATVGKIEFADETIWDYEYVLTHWNSAPSAGGGQTFEGTKNDDSLKGTNKDDVLIGKGGNDTLEGNDGNDTLQGGTGNDKLKGGNGNDRYLWNWGDGLDTIYDTNNRDTVVFGSGISEKDITYRNEGNNLRIIVKGNEAQGLLLEKFFNNGLQYKIEDLKFQDGKVIHLSEIPLTLNQKDVPETIYTTGLGDTIYGNGGDDTIHGGDGNDTIYGGDGDDTITGGNGMDTINGGKGNDIIDGNVGADTYIWNLGDDLDTIKYVSSIDTIKFGQGITFEDLTFRNDSGDLRIYVKGDENQGVICKDFFNDDDKKSKEIMFADGSTFALPTSGLTLTQKDTAENITATKYDDVVYGNAGDDIIHTGNGNDIVYGGNGNDNLYGENGDDIIAGNAGDDYIEGGAGNDTYIYNLGDGLDTIYDKSGTDKLKFGDGIKFSDFSYRAEGNNLRIILNGDEKQGIIINNFFNGNDYKIEKLEFADGSEVAFNQIGFELNQNSQTKDLTVTPYEDVVHLYDTPSNSVNVGAGNDVVYGGDYNDTITGHTGNDTLYGGAGNDTIYGDNDTSSSKYVGNDTLIGGTGNDYLVGGYGDDSYIYNLGDGLDIIYDTNGVDKIKFGEGIILDNFTYRAEGNNLHMILNGDETQGIVIQDYFNGKPIENIELSDGTVIDFTKVGFELNQNKISNNLTLTGNDDIIYLTPDYNNVNASGGNDTVYGNIFADTIDGGSGDDVIYGNDGNDKLIGHTGNDILYGGKGKDSIYGDNDTSSYKYVGNDTLIGGEGNDYLAGGYGNDTYIYNLGDGLDTIYDNNGTDKIKFGEGIQFADFTYRAEGNNLRMILNEDETQGLIINNFFGNNDNKIETLEFADGSTVAFDQIGFELQQNNRTNGLNTTNYDDIVHLFDMPSNNVNVGSGNDTVYGSNYNDTITGHTGNDTLYGGAGNDTIYGDNDTSSSKYVGNDTLIGGTGNDYLAGGYGDDNYIYNLGDGLDTIYDNKGADKIVFGEGIEFENISYRANGNNLQMIINNDENQGIIINNFFGSDDCKIETLEFADGTTAAFSQMGFELHQNNLTNGLVTTIYDDTVHLFNVNGNKISGGKGNDTIYGGSGNDTIYGDDETSSKYTVGNDTLAGGKGNDHLAGGYGNDTYVYNLGDGLDTIYDVTGTDTLKLGEDITLDNFTYRAEGNNLRMILNGDETQGIIIQDYFSGKRIENIELSDGTIIDFTKVGFELNQNNISNSLTLTDNDDILHLDDNYNNINAAGGNDIVYGNIFADTIDSGAGDDKIYGNNGDDTLIGSSGNDVLNGDDGNDTLYGDDRDSSKYTVGDDTLIGGKGNDYLAGGYGNDTYVYNLGDGLDTIYDVTGTDTLKFGVGITSDSFTYRAEGNNLRIILNNDETQGIIIQDHFNGKPVENIELSDGTIIDLTTLGFELHQNSQTNDLNVTPHNDVVHLFDTPSNSVNVGAGDDTVYGSAYNDKVIGGIGDDILDGGAGNDTLYGDDSDSSKYTVGNDTLSGGKGDDYLAGGYGNDTYIYNLGDGLDTIYDTNGIDTIRFGEGIALDKFTYRAEGNNLRMILNGNETQGIIIQDYFSGKRIENIELSDGTIIDFTQVGFELNQNKISSNLTLTENDDIAHLAPDYNNISASGGDDIVYGNIFADTIDGGDGDDIVYGNDGNDTLYGDDRDSSKYTVGDDTLIGGKGNDYLVGGYGDDTYVYNLGDGLDTIYDTSGNDKIIFGEEVNVTMLSLEQSGNNLRILINNDENQGIQINDHFGNSAHRIENIEFTDGSTLDISNAAQLIQAMNTFGISHSATTDTLSGITDDVGDMCNLAANELNKKTI